MRTINFQEVGMKNFGPYIEPMILNFKNDSLVLMTGPNGIGKTMSLDAIPFTLYGVTSKRARGDDVVNNVTGKNCKTWVKFTINDDQYLVTRYHKYTKLGNTVVLNKNGVDIKTGHKEVLPEIERLIRPQKTFMNTLFFGQKVKDFFTDLIDSEKKEIFRKIIGLEKYSEYYKAVDKRIKDLNDIIYKAEKEFDVTKGLIEDANENIKELKEKEKLFYNEKAQELEEIKKQIRDNDRLLKKWKETLEKFNVEHNIDELSRSISDIDNKLSQIESRVSSELQELQIQKQNKIAEIKDLAAQKVEEVKDGIAEKEEIIRNDIQTVELNRHGFIREKDETINKVSWKISEIKTNIKYHTERINEIQDNILNKDISLCPTCEQEVDETTKKTLLDKIENYKDEIKKLNDSIPALEKEIADLEHEKEKGKSDFKFEMDQLKAKLSNLKTERDTKVKEINDRLNETIQKIEAVEQSQKTEIINKITDEKRTLSDERQSLVRKQEIAKSQANEKESYEKSIKECETTKQSLEFRYDSVEKSQYDSSHLDNYKNKLTRLKQKATVLGNELKENNELVDILLFWKGAFSPTGIPSMLIDEAIPFMNEKIAEYLDMITNGRYVVSFDTLAETKAGEFRDKISVHVLDTFTRANSRTQLSGGQTRIIDIATILTLADLNSVIQDVKINIMLFDEIFDSLDDENIGYVAKVLNKLKIGKAVHIISHQHQDHLEADEILSYN
jgi:exonuclease SbcC